MISKWFIETVLKMLPFSAIEPLAKFIALSAYFGLGKRRRFALANLKLAFGEKLSPKERDKILRKNLFLFIRGVLETGKSLYLSPDFFSTHFVFVGEEYLKAAYLKGKGVITVSAHMGNFPLFIIYLALKGYRVATIAKIPKRGPLAELFESLSKKFGFCFIQARGRKKAVREALKHLRQGGLLFLQVDQNAPQHRAMIPFFGYSVPTPRGPVLLAKKTGASILPVFILDESNFYHRVFIEPPLKLGENVDNNLIYLMQRIELYARRYPEQYWWWHRRFKKYIDYKRL